MTDEQLALAAQAGDSGATRTLLEKYKNAVRAAARSFFLEGGDTEDLVQEGMIGLYLAVTDYREGGMRFKNFAYLCIRRRIMGAVKSASGWSNPESRLPISLSAAFMDSATCSGNRRLRSHIAVPAA